MGAYLLFKLLRPRDAERANAFLDDQPEQKVLERFGRAIWFWSREDREIEKKRLRETGNGAPDFLKIGEGQWKASGLSIEEEICYPLVALLFAKLHQRFGVKIYRGSCALENGYFTKEQIALITKNGKALSRRGGDSVGQH